MQYILKLVVVLVLMAPSAGRAALIAYWNFNESGGTTANDSAGTYDGTLVNAASFVSGGIAGNALSLSEAGSGYVTMGDVLGLTGTDFSLVAWVKTTDPTVLLFSKHTTGSFNGYWLATGYTSADDITFYSSGANLEPVGTEINDGAWHQVVGTYNAGLMSIYVDGALVSSAGGNPIVGNAAPLLIGAYGQTTGLIDEARVYNHALSGSEVLDLFQNTTAVPEPTAAGLWLIGGLLCCRYGRRLRTENS